VREDKAQKKKLNMVLFDKKREAIERKEEVNRKIAAKKAISVILRREATKAVIEKKKKEKGISPKRLLPRTVLEALHERITALRWDSALKVIRIVLASHIRLHKWCSFCWILIYFWCMFVGILDCRIAVVSVGI